MTPSGRHIALLALCCLLLGGCQRQGEARSRTVSVDASAATESTLIELEGVKMTLAGGATAKIGSSDAKTPLPANEQATAQTGGQDFWANAMSGAAALLSQTLGALSALVWIGALAVLAGVVWLALWWRVKGIGTFGKMPWWAGPAISICGFALIGTPHFVEVATPWLVGIFVTLVVAIVALAVYLGFRNYKKLETDFGLDIAGSRRLGE